MGMKKEILRETEEQQLTFRTPHTTWPSRCTCVENAIVEEIGSFFIN
jgi:hypothetical protein